MILTLRAVFCDGDGQGNHAPGCPVWNGEGRTARLARASSNFVQRPGSRDYSPECLAAYYDAAPTSDAPTA